MDEVFLRSQTVGNGEKDKGPRGTKLKAASDIFKNSDVREFRDNKVAFVQSDHDALCKLLITSLDLALRKCKKVLFKATLLYYMILKQIAKATGVWLVADGGDLVHTVCIRDCMQMCKCVKDNYHTLLWLLCTSFSEVFNVFPTAQHRHSDVSVMCTSVFLESLLLSFIVLAVVFHSAYQPHYQVAQHGRAFSN